MTVFDVIESIKADPTLTQEQKERAADAVFSSYNHNYNAKVDLFSIKSIISAALGWGLSRMLGGNSFAQALGAYVGGMLGSRR